MPRKHRGLLNRVMNFFYPEEEVQDHQRLGAGVEPLPLSLASRKDLGERGNRGNDDKFHSVNVIRPESFSEAEMIVEKMEAGHTALIIDFENTDPKERHKIWYFMMGAAMTLKWNIDAVSKAKDIFVYTPPSTPLVSDHDVDQVFTHSVEAVGQ